MLAKKIMHMQETFCPECGGKMFFEIAAKSFVCTKCGLFATREQISDLKYKIKVREDEERRKKKRDHGEYLEWWLSKK